MKEDTQSPGDPPGHPWSSLEEQLLWYPDKHSTCTLRALDVGPAMHRTDAPDRRYCLWVPRV